MTKKIIYTFIALLSCFYVNAEESLSIIYIHIGDSLPKHLMESIRQIRLHNSNEDIYLCGNTEALNKVQRQLKDLSVKEIPVETLPQSEQHQKFLRETSFTEPFWIRTTERLLFVHELIKKEKLENAFHIESDVMVYSSFRAMLPMFIKNYPSIAIPFANDQAAICSVIFIKNEKAASLMSDCIANHASEGENDMRLPGILKEEMGTSVIDHLPILPRFYVDKVEQSQFINKLSNTIEDKFAYCKYFEDFSCIFDAAAFGVFMCRKDGTIGDVSIFHPKVFNIIWKKGGNIDLYVLYVQYQSLCSLCAV